MLDIFIFTTLQQAKGSRVTIVFPWSKYEKSWTKFKVKKICPIVHKCIFTEMFTQIKNFLFETEIANTLSTIYKTKQAGVDNCLQNVVHMSAMFVLQESR